MAAAILFSTSTAQAEEEVDAVFRHIGSRDKPAVLIVHDWFGNSEFYREIGERLAAQDHSVIAVDLYGEGRAATTHQDAWNLMKVLDNDKVASLLDRGIAEAGQQGRGVITMGFSMGAVHSLTAAVRNNEEVVASIIFYGDPIFDEENLGLMEGPVLAIFGGADNTYGEESAEQVAAKFGQAGERAGLEITTHIFPGAAHAFAQPLFNGGATYDSDAADAAWRLALDFIDGIGSIGTD